MNQYARLSCIVILASLASAQLRADDLLWQQQPPPVSNNLGDANYFNNTTLTPNVAPTGSDILYIGAGGNVTQSGGTFSIQKLRVGNVLGDPAYQGDGTVTVNNGAQLSLTVGGGSALASLIIGGGVAATSNSGTSGTLNIDGANTLVTAQQVVQIGYGDKSTASATLNITNGAGLVVSNGNLNLGDRNSSPGLGVPGHLSISGANSSISILDLSNAGADLNIGNRIASTYVQSDGTVSVDQNLNVGQNTAQNSTATITGGQITMGNAITVGQNTAKGSSLSISGGTVTATASTSVGLNTADNSSLSISGGTFSTTAITAGSAAANASVSVTGNAVVNVTTGNFNIGTGALNQGASLIVGGTADINILAGPSSPTGNGNVFIGRSTSNNASFTMTGGTIDTGRGFLVGSGLGATNIVGTQSGGTITTTLNFVLSDTGGASTYNLSGAGAIVSNGLIIVGRQSNTGTMNQTGGTVTAALGVTLGNAQNVTTSLWGTGIYNVSGGTITANQTTGPALSIAPQGTGTFRVIGDDATLIDVNGNMTVNAGGGALGTLAFQLETGDLLSQIDVRDVATFSAGAILWFDTSLAAPTQTTYNLLTATSIVDNGITKNFPSGWDYRIVAGGNGQILQAFQPPVGLPGDFNSDGKVDAGDYVTWRRNEVTNAALANDNGVGNQADRFTLWRANFGNPPGAGTSLQGAQVPEPASLMLVFVGAAALVGIRRR